MKGGRIEPSNTSNGASVWIGIPSTERHLVFALFAVIVLAVLLSVSYLAVEVRRDGHGRMPQRPLVRSF